MNLLWYGPAFGSKTLVLFMLVLSLLLLLLLLLMVVFILLSSDDAFYFDFGFSRRLFPVFVVLPLSFILTLVFDAVLDATLIAMVSIMKSDYEIR